MKKREKGGGEGKKIIRCGEKECFQSVILFAKGGKEREDKGERKDEKLGFVSNGLVRRNTNPTKQGGSPLFFFMHLGEKEV